MNTRNYKLLGSLSTLLLGLFLFATDVSAQNSRPPKTDSKMAYHGGPVLKGTTSVYLIFYGCWNCGFPGSNLDTMTVLAGFTANLGQTQYFLINTGYGDSTGGNPNGALVFSGSVEDMYSHGNELTSTDIQNIISDKFNNGTLPAPPGAVYIVIASSDVASNSTGFCTNGAPPHHGTYSYFGFPIQYAFIGNASRCPSVAAPQFMAPNGTFLPTPNDNLAADAMATTVARALNELVTNPMGNAWYDRYGLENAEKCVGRYGTTYITPNGARANMKIGGRDFLIQQNWVNSNRGHCSLAYNQ